MTDDNLEAAPEAVEEVVQSEAEQVEAPEAAESTEGEPQEVTAEDETEGDKPEADAEEKAKLTRSERRREAKERMQQELQESESARQKAERELERHRETAKALPKPKADDYADYEEYTAALSAYHSVQALDSREAQRLEAEAAGRYKQAQEIKKQQAAEDARNWVDQVADAKTRYADFEAVALSDSVRISQLMAEQIMQSDVAADLTYHIGKNPQIGTAMAEMEPIQLARALGRLEAQISAPKPKTVSTAPDPITPVRGKSSASKDPGDMTPKEYRAWVDSGGKF
jgi:hypothetical protein